MPVSRMRMRPWLEQKIESQTIAGLSWVDKEKKMFSIPWKHAARHGWEMDKDACLFKQWAIHTGKYIEGQTCDPKTWKANFRCAMNSLPDIKEMKDKSINKGHQAVRIFRMLPATQKSRDKQRKSNDTKTSRKKVKLEEDMDYSDTQSPMDQSQLHDDTSSTQENRVDSTVDTEQQEMTNAASSDVPDWCSTVEICSGLNSYEQKFQVSPYHSPEYDEINNFYLNEVIQGIDELCQQIVKGPEGHQIVDGKGFLGNEECNSPGSHWSDSSSAELDELDERPQYTTLETDDTLDSFNKLFYHQFMTVQDRTRLTLDF